MTIAPKRKIFKAIIQKFELNKKNSLNETALAFEIFITIYQNKKLSLNSKTTYTSTFITYLQNDQELSKFKINKDELYEKLNILLQTNNKSK